MIDRISESSYHGMESGLMERGRFPKGSGVTTSQSLHRSLMTQARAPLDGDVGVVKNHKTNLHKVRSEKRM